MSKKLTKSEQEFLVNLISNKIIEKKYQQLRDVVEKNTTFIELQKRADEINSLRKQLKEDSKQLQKELCEELGMSGGYGDCPINCDVNYDSSVKVGSLNVYDVHRIVQEKLMYEQIVLGGISEDLVNRLVQELS